ncbi:RecB family exonuclease [Catenuloplanes atrovinosus]|uniref:RecB family exonuclease n=1 Tax=Catenuloplanes atrovinosus TaxID=137266 RepID=A0AAE3YLM4_9ACTN|nr:PD-(D/E)XK nuclease family protein [Catenuloplanes atrovinosus]MDR7274561.1 putative RecB family exonuclease [Catenuloplanes atrovinosus]
MTTETEAPHLPTGRSTATPAELAEPDWTGPSLSPSRAGDFKTCPLLFRFRTIDRIPEQPTADQLRGTLVHAVLERLYDLPAADRTPDAAFGLVAPSWERLLEEDPALATLFEQPVPEGARAEVLIEVQPGETPVTGVEDFLASARDLVKGYFTLEDPRRLEPAEREQLISTVIDDRLRLRGFVDRLDVSPDGQIRVVDYKTGGAPRAAFEAKALFQLKFYALVLWRTRGVVPRVLRLIYLKDVEVCDYSPDVEELERFERTVLALAKAIETATATRDFRPQPSKLCGWCNHKALCPAYGGTPPPYPEPVPQQPTADQRA